MQRKLLTSKEAAQYLGISLSFLRKMMMNRVIPMSKMVGLRLIDTHPTGISVGCDKNGRIMAVFGLMD